MNDDKPETEEMGMEKIAGMLSKDIGLFVSLLSQGSDSDDVRGSLPNNGKGATTQLDLLLAKDIFLLLKAKEYQVVEDVLHEIIKVFPVNIRGLFESMIEDWLKEVKKENKKKDDNDERST